MKIALIENTGKDFYMARIRFARFLQEKGHHIIAIVPNDGYDQLIKDEGFEVVIVGQNIRGVGFLNKLKFTYDLYKILNKIDVDIIHCYRMQPNIIGGFLGGILGCKRVFNHITGLGIVFTENTFKNKIQQNIIKFGYNFNNRIFKTKYIFQNKNDVEDLGIRSNYIVIPGSAVNEDLFFKNRMAIPTEVEGFQHNPSEKNILFVSRLIRSKGLEDLVNAVALANTKYNLNCKLRVVGWIDSHNTNSHTLEEINSFKEKDCVIFFGQRSDVHDLVALSHICILPTYYREGTPRFLLEAMACGKPIITTKMPGCDHLVVNKTNGVLVNKQSPQEIASALKYIIENDLLDTMGEYSNIYYQTIFSESIVYNRIYKFYYQN